MYIHTYCSPFLNRELFVVGLTEQHSVFVYFFSFSFPIFTFLLLSVLWLFDVSHFVFGVVCAVKRFINMNFIHCGMKNANFRNGQRK